MIHFLKDECEKYRIDLDTATTLKYMADLKIDLENLKIMIDDKEEYKMCKAIDELQEDFKNEGYKLGLDEGYKSGMNEGYKSGTDIGYITGLKESTQSLMESLNISLEQALDMLKIKDSIRAKFYS